MAFLNDKTLFCDFCPFASKWKITLKSHFSEKHATVGNNRGTDMLTETACNIPNEDIPSYPNEKLFLKDKIRKHTERKNKVYYCKDCAVVFKTEMLLENHQIKFRCSIDGMIWSEAKVAKNVCELCGFQTENDQLQTNHKCEMKPLLRCNLCSYATRLEGKYELHTSLEHMAPLKCNQCEFKAPNNPLKPNYGLYMMTRHMDSSHSTQLYICHICNEQVKSKYRLGYHIETKHTQFNCSECGKSENTKHKLKRHMVQNHDHRSPLCSFCEFSAPTKYILDKHQQQMHSFKAAFPCRQCTFNGQSKYLLEKHIKTNHSAESWFTCNECEYKGESRYMLLKHHKFKHIEDPWYMCNQCKIKIKSKHLFKKHLKLNHDK